MDHERQGRTRAVARGLSDSSHGIATGFTRILQNIGDKHDDQKWALWRQYHKANPHKKGGEGVRGEQVATGRELEQRTISLVLGSQCKNAVESSWNVMAHGDAREGRWRGNWRTEWVASTRHTTSEHGVSSITTADAHTSAASSRLNWRPLPI